MIGACPVLGRAHDETPAIVHVDATARPQVITERAEPAYAILDALRAAGAPPVLINTSFNLRGEPIVDDAAGALRSARAMQLDFLILHDRLVDLTRQQDAVREAHAAGGVS
jgi:carbamoyltransferase